LWRNYGSRMCGDKSTVICILKLLWLRYKKPTVVKTVDSKISHSPLQIIFDALQLLFQHNKLRLEVYLFAYHFCLSFKLLFSTFDGVFIFFHQMVYQSQASNIFGVIESVALPRSAHFEFKLSSPEAHMRDVNPKHFGHLTNGIISVFEFKLR